MVEQQRQFLVIDKKSFDVVREGRKTDGIRISENGKGFWVMISLKEEEVVWLI